MNNLEALKKDIISEGYHKNFANNQLKAHNKIANFIKWIVQATGNKLEKIGSYIRHLGKAHHGLSLAERSISVRVNSAKDMYNNDYLMLGSNKNFKVYQNTVELIYEKHPDVDGIVPCDNGNDNGNGWYAHSTYKCIKNNPSEEAKKKFIYTNMMWQRQNGEWAHKIFNSRTDVHEMVNSMFNDTVAQKGEHFSSDNCKEIKLIVEIPPFLTETNTNSCDCAEAYITACEAWMLHMQTAYKKKVTILSFSNHENQLKHITDNNYDNANTAIATKTKKDRESDLTSYIEKYKLNQTKLKTEPALDNTSQKQGDNNDQQTQQPDNTSIGASAKPKSEGAVDKTTKDILSALTFMKKTDIIKRLTAKTEDIATKNYNLVINTFKDKLEDIEINTKIQAKVCDLSEREDNLTNISLPEINNQDSFFLKDITTLHKKDNNSLAYICNLNFTDAALIDELPNNIDSGLATIEYMANVAKNTLNIKDASATINQDYIKDTAMENKVNLSVFVRFHIPKEFDTAILTSNVPEIKSLAEKYGSRTLLLAAISLA